MSSNSRVHVWPACWQLELTLLLIALVVTSISSLPIEASIFFWIFVILFSIKSSGDKSYDDHKVTELPCSPTDKDNTKLETKIYEELNSLLHSQQEDAFTRAEPLFGEYPRTYMECTGNRIWIESDDSYYAIWSSIHGTFSRNIFSSFTQFVQHLRELMQPVSYLKSIDFIDVCLTKQLCRTFIYSQVNIKTLQFSNCEIRVKPDVFQSFLKCLHVEKLISEESTYHCPNLLSDEMFMDSNVKLMITGTNDCSGLTDIFLHKIDDSSLPSLQNCRTGFTVNGIMDRIKNQVHPASNLSIDFGVIRSPRTKNLRSYLTVILKSIRSGKKSTIDENSKDYISVEIYQASPPCSFRFKVMKPSNFKS